MRGPVRWLGVAVAAGVLSSASMVPALGAAADPAPLGLSCTVIDEGVRHCPGDGADDRIPSFDGIPIDLDVNLPPTGDGPWPTIVMINGLGGDKTQLQNNLESPPPAVVAPVPPNTTRYDSIHYASNGYAVVNISTRGFGQSCGTGALGLGASGGAKTQAPPCDQGFVRVADARFEGRDVQHVLGLLVDEGISVPDANGATGFSYGGGIAAIVGALNDRVMCDGVDRGDLCGTTADGELVPWTSPAGTPMSMGGVYGMWMWSDLIGSVIPNGRFLDFDPATTDDQLTPIGIYAKSYFDGLLGLADTQGYVQVTGSQLPNIEWDLEAIIGALNAGEPYDTFVGQVQDAYVSRHGALGIGGTPAPMLLEAGFTDDLFPAREPLKLYTALRDRLTDPDVVMLLGDYGHYRSSNRPTTAEAFNDIAFDFFESRLKGVGDGPAPGSVTVYETTCPSQGDDAAVEVGPYTAASWEAMSDDVVTFGDAAAQTVVNPGGNPDIGTQFDPIPESGPNAAGFDSCKAIPAPSWPPGTVALYEHEVTETFTMIGLPTVRATIVTQGVFGQLHGRLYDVDPDGNHRLVSRGPYRLEDNQSGALVFQLLGNAYTFEAGHTIVLELAPSDHPMYRQADDPFQVTVADLTVELPVVAPSAVPDRDPPDPVVDDGDDDGGGLADTGGGAALLAVLVLGAAAGLVLLRRRG